jgi:hypothetical protein
MKTFAQIASEQHIFSLAGLAAKAGIAPSLEEVLEFFTLNPLKPVISRTLVARTVDKTLDTFPLVLPTEGTAPSLDDLLTHGNQVVGFEYFSQGTSLPAITFQREQIAYLSSIGVKFDLSNSELLGPTEPIASARLQFELLNILRENAGSQGGSPQGAQSVADVLGVALDDWTPDQYAFAGDVPPMLPFRAWSISDQSPNPFATPDGTIKIALDEADSKKGTFSMGEFDLDVTQAVKDWIAKPKTNHGFILATDQRADTTGDDNMWYSAYGNFRLIIK